MTLARRARAMFHAPGRAARVVVLVACMAIVGMYCTNHDMAGQPDAPRGTGKYLPILDRDDGHMLYLMARSTAIDLDWRFDNDLARFGDPWNEPRTATGRKSIVQPLGPALVWTPLIWIAEAGAAVADLLGADIPLHGYTLWHQRFVFLSSALLGCGAVVLGLLVARRAGLSRWTSTYAGVAILLGTSLTYYATYMPSYSHALDAFACAAFFAYWARTWGRLDLRRYLALGGLLGVATLVRAQELAIGVVLAFEIALTIVGDLARRPRPLDWRMRALLALGGGALVVIVALIVFVPQLLEWKLVFGSATHLPQGPKYTRPGSPMILELLYSARNGWFSSTPLAYAGTLGLLLAPRRQRTIALGLFVALAVQVYLASTIVDWWGSASFGQRRLCNVTLPLVFGLACLLARGAALATRVLPRLPRATRHACVCALLAPFCAWNVGRAFELRGGDSADSELEPCCERISQPLRAVAYAIYDRIGNPFEFPANAYFALRYGGSLTRWDRAVGDYPLVPPFGAFRDDDIWSSRGQWTIGGDSAMPYLLAGWSPAFRAERAARWTVTATARILVPNLMPYSQRIAVWLAPGGSREVALRWDGELVAHATLHDGWQAVTFDLETPSVGEHVLAIEAPPAVLVAALPRGWPPLTGPTGVAASSIDLSFIKPR